MLKNAGRIGNTGALNFNDPTASTLGFASHVTKTDVSNSSVDITNANTRKALVNNLKDGYHQVIRIYNSAGTASQWFAIDEEKTLAAAGDKTTIALSDIYIFRPTSNTNENADYTLQQFYDSNSSLRYIRKNHAFLGGTTPSRKINYDIVLDEGSIVAAHKGAVEATYTIGDEVTSFASGDYVPSRATVNIKYNADPCYYKFVNWTTSDTEVSSLDSEEADNPKSFTIDPGEFRASSGSIVNSEAMNVICNITPVIYNLHFEDGEHFSYSNKKSSAGYNTVVSFNVNPDNDYTVYSVRFKDENDDDIGGINVTQSNNRYTFNMPAQDVYISVEVTNQSCDDFRTWGVNDSRWGSTVLRGSYTMGSAVSGGGDAIMAFTKLLIQSGYPAQLKADLNNNLYDENDSEKNSTFMNSIISKSIAMRNTPRHTNVYMITSSGKIHNNDSYNPGDESNLWASEWGMATIANRLSIIDSVNHASTGSSATYYSGGTANGNRSQAFYYPNLLPSSSYSVSTYTNLIKDYLAKTYTVTSGISSSYLNSNSYKFHLMLYINDTIGWVAVDEAQTLNTGKIWVWASHGRVSGNGSDYENVFCLEDKGITTFKRAAGFKFADGSLLYGSSKVEYAPQDSTVLTASYNYLGHRYPAAGTYSSGLYVPRNAALQINGAYAGQSITVTPIGTSSKGGTISYNCDNYGTATVSGSSPPFTFTSPLNIGSSADSTAEYSFAVTPTDSSVNDIPAVTITVNVKYSDIQKAYINLYNDYNTYNDKGASEYDTVSGWSDFNTALSTARTAVSDKISNPDYVVAYNSSDTTPTYNTKRTNLVNAYDNMVLKTNTIYALVKENYSDNVKIHVWDTDKQNKLFSTEASYVVSGNTDDFLMKKEGVTYNGKQLYSFTYTGYCSFIIYYVSGTTVLDDAGESKLTDDVLLNNKESNNVAYDSSNSRYEYGEYYLDLKGVSTSDSPAASVSNVVEFVEFSDDSIHVDEITNDLFSLYDEENGGYSLSQIRNRLEISYTDSSLADSNGSAQTVYYSSYTITGPVNRTGVPSSAVTVDSTHNWEPTEPGKYEVTLHANLGTFGADSTINSTADYSQDLYFYVAFDEIKIYADMNGNVGTPTIHLPYLDNQNQPADLPYEFDMVTGSESIYSVTISLARLRQNYNLDLVEDERLSVSKISVDSIDITDSGFDISKAAAYTGTLWLKADSTHMKTFNKIAYGSSTRTFKAVLRNGNTDTDFNNTFAEVNGTGIITDELVGDSYQYTSFYAAKDTTADYNFSYILRAKAQTDITHKDGNTTNYYYFDHWERINGNTTTTTGLTEVNGADINILKAPNYATDADVTYVAVYKLTSTQKRVEITYKFQDYDTDDENYVYDPDKPLKDATYTKTVNWNGTTDLSTVAQNSCPIIKSNYFDYTFDVSTANVTTTQSEDPNTHKTCITAELKQTPHKYKIILGSNTYKGYYQQSVALTAAGSNYKWYVKDANNNKIFIGNGQTYNARFGVYQDAGSETESGVSYQYDICTIYNESGTAAINSSIVPAHQEVYYDNDTPKVRHNFFIIDAYDNSGEFVGAGVLYATTDSSGNYRQSNAATVLGSTNSVNTSGISNFITGVLNPNNNLNTAKYDTEFKAQTINNVGFRYLPYSGNESIIRYSNELKAYMYTFAGENTNSESLNGQKLRVFSFFVYKNGNTYTNVVSSMYAQVERYIS